MQDTIELLEAIGGDASLRHAPAPALGELLSRHDAAPTLINAVLQGNAQLLAAELGQKPMQVDQHSHVTGHDEDQPDDDREPPGQDSPAQPDPVPHSS